LFDRPKLTVGCSANGRRRRLVTYITTLRDFIVFESMIGIQNCWFTVN